MGMSIHQSSFSAADFERFTERLRANLQALELLLARPDFGVGPSTLGAELEMSLVDGQGRALCFNKALLGADHSPQLQAELNCFNLEYNLSFVNTKGKPFARLEAEMSGALEALARQVGEFGGRIAAAGILPTLRPEDLDSSAMSDIPRFQALSNTIRQLRGGSFKIRIDGPEPLSCSANDVTLEGANNSFQLHFRVPPDEFIGTFNALQMVTPLAVAIGANSPIFLEHRLWEETRIALFRQAVDTRGTARAKRLEPSRVLFGNGWGRRSPMELFAEAAALFPPLLPASGREDPLGVAKAGGIPELAELCLHLSSVWPWNRPVYDPREGGHLRIEIRSLPSGPTPVDMTASAAFLLGTAVGLRPAIDRMLLTFPFWCAEYNFYRAAKHGLDADLLWPPGPFQAPVDTSVAILIRDMVPVAEEGLAVMGVESGEIKRLLDIIRGRLDTGINGSRWQSRILEQLEPQRSRTEALGRLLELYLERGASGCPVHEWDLGI